MKDNNNNTMAKFSPALGIVFGSGLGSILGVLTTNNLALTSVMGAGLGLVIGSIVYATAIQKNE